MLYTCAQERGRAGAPNWWLLAAALGKRETYGVDDEGWCVGQGEAWAVGFFADESGEEGRRRDQYMEMVLDPKSCSRARLNQNYQAL